MPVLIRVHAHHKGAHTLALTGGRDQHLAGTGLDVLTGTFLIDKDAGGLDHQVDAPLLPGQVEGIAIRETFDVLAIHHDRVVGMAHLRIADVAKHRVVLKQVGVGLRIGGVV